MNIEIGLLIALCGGIIGICTFMLGRQAAAKKDGERWGRLEADMGHIKDDISYIKASIEKSSKDTKESIRRVHERLDDHLRLDHGMTIPKREDN